MKDSWNNNSFASINSIKAKHYSDYTSTIIFQSEFWNIVFRAVFVDNHYLNLMILMWFAAIPKEIISNTNYLNYYQIISKKRSLKNYHHIKWLHAMWWLCFNFFLCPKKLHTTDHLYFTNTYPDASFSLLSYAFSIYFCGLLKNSSSVTKAIYEPVNLLYDLHLSQL